MNRLLFAGMLIVAGAQGVLGQPSPAWVNTTTINAPPQDYPVVYALNFTNLGTINLAENTFVATTLQNTFIQTTPGVPFDFTSVNYYTNRGRMTSDTGFRFDTAPSGAPGDTGARHMAGTFGNANVGGIFAGSLNNIFIGDSIVFFAGAASPQLLVSATNVVNRGLLDVGLNGLIDIGGKSVDLSHSTLTVEGLDAAATSLPGGGCFAGRILTAGLFDNYWGIGRGTNIGGNFALQTGLFGLPPTTPLHNVTFAGQGGTFPSIQSFSVPNAQAFMNRFIVNGDQSNRITQAVFVGNFSSDVSTTVRFEFCQNHFPFPVPVIRWQSVVTNTFTQQLVTNELFLSDFFGGSTNFINNTNASLTGSPIPTQSPINYQFTRSFFNSTSTTTNTDYNSLPTNNVIFDSAFLAVGAGFTNSYAGYGATLLPVSARPDPAIPTSNITNTPGRIQITADKVLDLTGATITGPNYLRLNATNHFVGSKGAQLISAVTDLNLGTTNGLLAITNLVAPFLPRMAGDIQAWSGNWTNVDAAGVTNRFHVLMVASSLVSTSTCSVLNFAARSTNVVISDLLNVTSNILVDAKSLTITTNGAAAPTPVGQLNLISPNMLWSSVLPNLQSVTNFGIITSPSGAFFQKRLSPDFPSPSDGPYASFINHGSIAMAGDSIWANYFENTGSGEITTNGLFNVTNTATLFSTGGPINVQSTTAILSNGLFAAAGDISVTSGSLLLSNQTFFASGKLTLTATNQLNFTADGSGRRWTNSFQVSDGFDLPIKPSTGDLLGTTITSFSTNYTVVNNWAGQDRGNSISGFLDNAAIGHLILDGITNTCAFEFSPASGNNAIYVDLLELKDFATNRVTPNFTSLIVDDGMTVYFADARIGNLDISEKLNGANGGRLQWVSNYNNGPFSSTNLTYPSGNVYSFNRGLVTSASIDSDGDGVVNGSDSTPFFEPENLVLGVTLTNAPSPQARISWVSPANVTNYLYRRTGVGSTNWVMVTNFVKGPTVGPVVVTDKLTNGPCFYKVGLSSW